jgi:nucleotide-binding universal stress UspA family protein
MPASPVRRTVVATEFPPTADHALDIAIDLAKALGAAIAMVPVTRAPRPGLVVPDRR